MKNKPIEQTNTFRPPANLEQTFDMEAFKKTKEYKQAQQLRKTLLEYERILQKRSLEELLKLEDSMREKRYRNYAWAQFFKRIRQYISSPYNIFKKN